MSYKYFVTIMEKDHTWNKFEFVFGALIKAMDFAESIMTNFHRRENYPDQEIIVTIRMNQIVLDSEVESNDVVCD